MKSNALGTLPTGIVTSAGLQKGQRQAIAVRPQAMLEAKDLPKCDLSNYLSERLDSVLERDRQERADRDGCPIEHVSPLFGAITPRALEEQSVIVM